jgi:cardiolipin synthase
MAFSYEQHFGHTDWLCWYSIWIYNRGLMRVWTHLFALFPVCFIVAGGLTACGSDPQQMTYPTLVGEFADESGFKALVADEAYINESEFFIRFSEGGNVAYGGGNWARRIPILEVGPGEAYAGPYIVPLQYRREKRWRALSGDIQPVRILSKDDWMTLRGRLFAEILPKKKSAGVVLHLGVDDYFLYFDENQEFQSTVIDNRPADYETIRRVEFAEMLEAGLPVLEKFLDEKGVDDRRIAFNTGDKGHYSLPFLYVNRDLPVAVFVRLPGPRLKVRTGGKPVPYMQTAGHIAGSHTTGIVFRPVSSIFRLLFVATDTVFVSAKPNYLVSLQKTPIPELNDGPGMDLRAWESHLDRITGRESSKGTMDFLVDGEEFFTRLTDAITSADASISLRTYIFDNDDYAARIGELLKRRSNEGIETKVLLDGLGTIISTIEEQETLPDDYSGPVSVRRFLEADSEVDVRQAPNPWLTGDHVKTAIIDKKIAFTGGMNIAREYRYDWHDLMVELHGPIVDVLQYEFGKAWAHAGFLGDFSYLVTTLGRKPGSAENIGYPVRALFTRVDSPEIFRVQREAIRNSKKYVYVENAYFTDDAMLYELAKARRRGVDVRVIVPLVTDRGPITRNNALAANAMLEHGIRVFIYPGMSHVKAALYDDWACLGSANWDRWSFRINKELNIATSEPSAVHELKERVFEADFAASVELTEPFPERWSDYLIEIVGDFIF